jgi:hypothetical protein
MPVSKPATVFSWAASGTKTAPSGGKIAAGFASPELPSDGEMNWMFGLIGDWLAYVDDQLPPSAAAAGSLDTTGDPVDVAAAAPPSTGQVLMATDPTHATWQALPMAAAVLGWSGVTSSTTVSYGNWYTKTLATEISDPSGIVSLSGNSFTLQAGTYLISWAAMGGKQYNSGSTPWLYRTRLIGTGVSVEGTCNGTGTLPGSEPQIQTSVGFAIVTPASAVAYRIEEYFPNSSGTNYTSYYDGSNACEPLRVSILKIA